MKDTNKNFSIKKLLLTILCTVVVSVFIGTTLLFVGVLPNWIQFEIVPNLDKNSEVITEIGKNYEEDIERITKKIDEDKATYGENYPAEELFLSNLMNLFSSSNIVSVYSTSFLAGIALGSIIYIVAIQNAKGRKLVIELLLTFVVLFVLMIILNLGYELIINMAINKIAPIETKYSTYIYDLKGNNVLIPYLIAIAVIYIVNMVYQKIVTNKLNKELNKK